jgi:hypothetical protein
MKALSIQHPWVDAILAGEKTIEIRSWETTYRGEFLLHASKAWGKKQRDLFGFIEREYKLKLPFPEHAGQNGIVGIATLESIRSLGGRGSIRKEARAALAEPADLGLPGWRLINVRALDFIPCAGALKLFNVPPEVEAQVLAQLGRSLISLSDL